TCAPAFTSRRASSQALYAAIPPPTQRSTRRPCTLMGGMMDRTPCAFPLLLYGPRAEAAPDPPRHPRRAARAQDRRGGPVLGPDNLPALDHRARRLALERDQPGRPAVPGSAPARGGWRGLRMDVGVAAGVDSCCARVTAAQ